AFFGEKYEDKVRVVSVGEFSKELCGGTHLDSTGQIGLFKIIQEGSVASGVRRIEATTGTHAYKLIKNEEEVISDISALLKVPQQNIVRELQKKLSRVKEIEKQLEGGKFDTLKTSIQNDIDKRDNFKGINYITHVDENPDSVRRAVDLIKEKVKENAIIVSATSTGKFFVLGITQDLCEKGIDASKLIHEAGYSGGGRKDFAQAGTNQAFKLDDLIKKIKERATPGGTSTLI
ncbi:MAG: hypothetical protein AMJ95_13125, partial [Omnitrophica WOR_2 bacterium SM23_72]